MILEREPLTPPDPGLATTTDLVVARERAAPDHVALDVPDGDGGWRPVATAELAAQQR